MYTINENINNTIIVKNSKFITLLIKLDKSSNIKEIINDLKIKYPKATHYTYAYRFDKNNYGYSDDKEPTNTAGLPTYNVLEKKDLINVLAVTIRYFGGIKLGAAGLVRAYTKSISTLLNNINLKEVELYYLVELTTSYNDKFIDNNKFIIKEKIFDINIAYKLLIKKIDINLLNNYKYKILDEIYY